MDLLDLLPFRKEMAKAYYGLTDNATHTSVSPIFPELKVRRFAKKTDEISEYITSKIDQWVGWDLRSKKTAVGGMTVIQAEVSSFALLGIKIKITLGLLEETDCKGERITTINAKAETQIESKGDMGESRRMIRMILESTDSEFAGSTLTEDEYFLRSLDAEGPAAAFQQIFNQAELRHTKKPSGRAKATTIEFRKAPSKQVIDIKPSTKKAEPPATPSSTRPKVTVITTKKSL